MELKLLFKAFRRATPKKGVRAPHWDVNIVLSSLKTAPFEPMLAESMRQVTMKVLFLVALATAHRVGELQALSHSVGFSRDGSALLAFTPEFIAKTEYPDRPVHRSFRIESLSSLTLEREELLLCPVRALKAYLKLTKAAGRAKTLFVSPRNFSQPLSKNGISFFLRETIKHAYKEVSPHLQLLTRVNAHEIRAVSTSLRFKYNLGQVVLIKRAYWRSNTVFCYRYLRDISSVFLDVSALGPLVVAQGVVRPLD